MAIQTKDFSIVLRFDFYGIAKKKCTTCFYFSFLFFIFSSLYFHPNSQRKWEKGRQQIYLAVEEDRLGNCPLQFKFFIQQNYAVDFLYKIVNEIIYFYIMNLFLPSNRRLYKDTED